MYTKGFEYVNNVLLLVSVDGKLLKRPLPIVGLNLGYDDDIIDQTKQYLYNSQIPDNWMERINRFLKFRKYVCMESFQTYGKIEIDSYNNFITHDDPQFDYICVFHKQDKNHIYYGIFISNEKHPGYRFNKTFGLYVSKMEKIETEEE